jgi:uncharacterized membrane protein
MHFQFCFIPCVIIVNYFKEQLAYSLRLFVAVCFMYFSKLRSCVPCTICLFYVSVLDLMAVQLARK